MERITEKIKKWYRGKHIPPDFGNGGLAFINHYEKSPSARVATWVVEFWLKHWHVLFPTLVAAAVALFIHFDSSNGNSTGKTEQEESHQITGADQEQG